MTPYYAAWLKLIDTRDDFYLLALLLVATAVMWYKFGPLPGKFTPIYQAGGLALVLGMVGWGYTLL